MTDKLARNTPALLQRLQRSPLGGLLPDVLAATLSIGKSSRADPMGLIVAMMSGFAGVFAPSSAHRVEHALMEFARELEALEGERSDLRDEEFLHLLRDLIVHSGRTPDIDDRARLRHVLLRGIREREPPARIRVFFELATRVHNAELETLRTLERSGTNALATTLDTFGMALLEREGLVAQGAITALGAQFLSWLEA